MPTPESAVKITTQELVEDFKEAMTLLTCAGPNNLLIVSTEYYQRLHKLQEKYGLNEEDEDEAEEEDFDFHSDRAKLETRREIHREMLNEEDPLEPEEYPDLE